MPSRKLTKYKTGTAKTPPSRKTKTFTPAVLSIPIGEFSPPFPQAALSKFAEEIMQTFAMCKTGEWERKVIAYHKQNKGRTDGLNMTNADRRTEAKRWHVAADKEADMIKRQVLPRTRWTPSRMAKYMCQYGATWSPAIIKKPIACRTLYYYFRDESPLFRKNPTV